ncbi:transient-receptor-potential-like protein [Patiria miniata]|uniref:Transient receptor ion channel domain-containing protein n=1 Tax=Patiria miniata TaxID=46514 RepID=A0A913ZY99_PATMI|nr:transient-receptor-potential-like protein [Patiria miniata]
MRSSRSPTPVPPNLHPPPPYPVKDGAIPGGGGFKPSMHGQTNLGFTLDSHHPVLTVADVDRTASLISGVSSIPLQLFSEGNRLTAKEWQFLEAAERGDKATVERCLLTPNPVNVNVTNILGRSALQMVVDNENVEIVELLLKQDKVEIGDALLYAIREGVYKMVEMMVNHPSITRNMLGEGWSSTHFKKGQESSDYSYDISPVILAAHCNQFEILQLLLTRGATISKPHPCICKCDTCTEKQLEDSLRYSLHRINTFKALASPAWISLTSSDPILSAFKLSWELQHLAMRENEFKDIYMQLNEQTKSFTVDLLEQCRSSEEVNAVLNKESESDDEVLDEDLNGGRLSLARLRLALKYEQKQFVAHPNTQQVLSSIWYEGLPGWRGSNVFVKFLLCIAVMIMMPIDALVYLFFPKTRMGQMMRSPFMKFMHHSSSFVIFLALLVLLSAKVAGSNQNRGRPPDVVESLIFVWVIGMIWGECKQLWEEGLKAYIRQWWNWLDFIMLTLYLCTFSLRITAMIQAAIEPGYGKVLRAEWPSEDPTLISECLFAMANVFSFARIIYLFQANPYLGPLQISLGCMLIDIAKFFFIFFLVLLSFACGMNQLYWYYGDNGENQSCNATAGDAVQTCNDFSQMSQSFLNLLWALFGLTSKDAVKLTHWKHRSVETVGELLLLTYHIIAIIVLLNMLIAMMSNSFQTIQDHADREWKFARSKLWMSYFDEGSTLPPPFNLIISPKSIYYFISGMRRMLCGYRRSLKTNYKPRKRRSLDGTIRVGDGNLGAKAQTAETRYQDVMKRLVSRYIQMTKANRKADGVNEDDLNEIKQDISSLRYELREDRKREEAREHANMKSIKQEIINIVTSTSTALPSSRTPACPPRTSSRASTVSQRDSSVDSASSSTNHPHHREVHAPAPQYPTSPMRLTVCASPGDKDTPAALSGKEVTRRDLERLKMEIVDSLKDELHFCIQGLILSQTPPPPVPPPPSVVPDSAEEAQEEDPGIAPGAPPSGQYFTFPPALLGEDHSRHGYTHL